MILLDTDILVDAARGLEAAVTFLAEAEAESAVSAVTVMELLVGCRNKSEQRATLRFVERFDLLPLSGEIGERALSLLERYRLSHGLLIGDALIAATALVYGLTLVSGNERDFRFIEGLSLQGRPYQAE